MSQLNKHRDALIFGQKSSQLCFQLIKDAQLLCKRQMNQIRRQGGGSQPRNNDEEERKTGSKTAMDTNNYGKLNNAYDEQQSLNSYAIQSQNVDEKSMKINKQKRLRSCSNYAYHNTEG